MRVLIFSLVFSLLQVPLYAVENIVLAPNSTSSNANVSFTIDNPFADNNSFVLNQTSSSDGLNPLLSIKNLNTDKIYSLGSKSEIRKMFANEKAVLIVRKDRFMLINIFSGYKRISILEYVKEKDRFQLAYLGSIGSELKFSKIENSVLKKVNGTRVLYVGNSRLIKTNGRFDLYKNSSCNTEENISSYNCLGIAKVCDNDRGIGVRLYSVKREEWLSCLYERCKGEYVREGVNCVKCKGNLVKIKGQCQKPRRECTKEGGFGYQNWLITKKEWSDCNILRCLPGYFKPFNKCKRIASVLKKNKVKNVKELHDKTLFKESFSKMNTIDFNLDGVKDRISCSGNKVTIVDGVNPKNNLFKQVFKTKDSERVVNISRCEPVLFGKTPVVVIASFIRTKDHSKRYNDRQKVIFFDNNKFKVKTLKFADDKPYMAVARSVKCTRYNGEKVSKKTNKKFKDGHLCFYSSYLAADTGLSTTGLFKLEKRKDNLFRIKDLSPHPGLPWYGRAGTKVLGMKRFCGSIFSSPKRYEGAYMMDSTFLNRKGSPMKSILTVGQHSHIRKTDLFIDKNSPEGIGMSTSVIYETGCGKHSEFLTINSLSYIDHRVKPRCAYVTGEVGADAGSFKSSHSFLLCEKKDNTWVVKNLPLKINSLYTVGLAKIINDKIVIRSIAHKDNGKFLGPVFHQLNDNYFRNIKNQK